jgi:hypothetical protein
MGLPFSIVVLVSSKVTVSSLSVVEVLQSCSGGDGIHPPSAQVVLSTPEHKINTISVPSATNMEFLSDDSDTAPGGSLHVIMSVPGTKVIIRVASESPLFINMHAASNYSMV